MGSSAMLPHDKLESLTRRYAELDDLMCQPQVLADREQISKLSKERSELEPVMQAYARYRDVSKRIAGDEAALADPELRELAQLELTELQGEKTKMEESIQLL